MDAHGRDARVAQRPGGVERELGTLLVNSGVAFVKRHYMLSSMYVVGVVLVLFATGLTVSPEQETAYMKTLSKIDGRKIQKAQQRVWVLDDQYRGSKGWFSCDELCMENYAHLQAAQKDLAAVEKEFAAITSEAKQQVGLFSEYGVQEVRDLFWAQFAGGKDFAKRSSWYDLIFMSIGSMGRDESLVEFAIRFMFQMLINFTMGLIAALIGFYWYLWGVISTYEPNFLLALAFFVLASTAATSVVVSYLLGLYSAAAGSVYVAAKIGAQGAVRLQDEARRQQAFLREQQERGRRPHAE